MDDETDSDAVAPAYREAQIVLGRYLEGVRESGNKSTQVILLGIGVLGAAASGLAGLLANPQAIANLHSAGFLAFVLVVAFAVGIGGTLTSLLLALSAYAQSDLPIGVGVADLAEVANRRPAREAYQIQALRAYVEGIARHRTLNRRMAARLQWALGALMVAVPAALVGMTIFITVGLTGGR